MTCAFCDRPAENVLAATSRNPERPRCYWHRLGHEPRPVLVCRAPGCSREAGAYSGMCNAHVMARVEEQRCAR